MSSTRRWLALAGTGVAALAILVPVWEPWDREPHGSKQAPGRASAELAHGFVPGPEPVRATAAGTQPAKAHRAHGPGAPPAVDEPMDALDLPEATEPEEVAYRSIGEPLDVEDEPFAEEAPAVVGEQLDADDPEAPTYEEAEAISLGPPLDADNPAADETGATVRRVIGEPLDADVTGEP